VLTEKNANAKNHEKTEDSKLCKARVSALEQMNEGADRKHCNLRSGKGMPQIHSSTAQAQNQL